MPIDDHFRYVYLWLNIHNSDVYNIIKNERTKVLLSNYYCYEDIVVNYCW